MSAKQDRQGVRTASDLERKYDLGQDVSKVIGLAADAQKAASSAKQAAENAESLANTASNAAKKNTEDITKLDKRVETLEKSGGGGSSENGATFTPSVDSAGNLSWTNDKGLANPATVNIKGAKGDKGDSPQKGTDYWTEADKQEIITEAQTGLGVLTIAEVQAICT